jgi:hypothetical protein
MYLNFDDKFTHQALCGCSHSLCYGAKHAEQARTKVLTLGGVTKPLPVSWQGHRFFVVPGCLLGFLSQDGAEILTLRPPATPSPK